MKLSKEIERLGKMMAMKLGFVSDGLRIMNNHGGPFIELEINFFGKLESLSQ